MDSPKMPVNTGEKSKNETYVPRIYSTTELEKIPFPTKDGFQMERICEINYGEADDKYTTIHKLDKSHFLVIKTLGEVEEIINSKTFFRAHAKYLVNGNQIHFYYKSTGEFLFENGVKLNVSERKEQDFIKFLFQRIKNSSFFKSLFRKKPKKSSAVTL